MIYVLQSLEIVESLPALYFCIITTGREELNFFSGKQHSISH